MRNACRTILFVALACGFITGQTVTPGFKFDKSYKPGDKPVITGTEMDKVTSVALRPDGKNDDQTDLKADIAPPKSDGVTFTVPSSANGKYNVILTPVNNNDPIPFTVTPTPAPVIDSVFPTTTFPVQTHFNFEINGQNFSSIPQKDEIEVEGQGPIHFGPLRYVSKAPDIQSEIDKEAKEACEQAAKNASLDKPSPCLGVTEDGHRLLISGYEKRAQYQGKMRVKVIVDGVPSTLSGYFTLSRVDGRVVLWLAIAFFALLMYIVYRLVSSGIQGYTIAGKKYSPLAAFLIDKTTDSYSLSKFQLFCFSLIMFFGYVYVYLCRALVQWNFTFPDIPENYPTLLAISAGTTVAAIGLTGTRGTKGGGPIYPSAADFISDGGLVVPERFQFFVWTLIACIGFIALLLMQDPATLNGFPNFPPGLLYVMGVSAGGYLGGKAVRGGGPILKQVNVGPAAAPAPPTDLSVTLVGENLDKDATFRINGAIQKVGFVKPTGDVQPQGPQGYYTRLTFTLDQASNFAKGGDNIFEIMNSNGVGAQARFTASPMKNVTALRPSVVHGVPSTVTLQIENFREGSSAQWLGPLAAVPADIPASQVKKTVAAVPPAVVDTVTVDFTPGDKAGTGTLTLVSPLGGTEALAVTVT